MNKSKGFLKNKNNRKNCLTSGNLSTAENVTKFIVKGWNCIDFIPKNE